MKRTASYLVGFLVTAFIFSTATYAKPETFILDNQHSYVLWTIKHLGFSPQVGKWYVNGEVVLDKEHPDQSKVNATVKIDDLNTGLPELDKHLKSKLFFDKDKFPNATFVSNKVQVLGDTSAKVTGMLTIHGITKPAILDVTLNKVGVNPITNKPTVGFEATTIIKRSDFGINTLLPDLGDEVLIQIGAEVYQDKK